MKRFFNEYSSVIIICIIISIMLCIFGSIKKVNEDGSAVEGSGLAAKVANSITDTIDTYHKQVVPNENLLINTSTSFSSNGYTIKEYHFKNDFIPSAGDYYTLSFEGDFGNSGANVWYANLLFYDENDKYTYPAWFDVGTFKKSGNRYISTAKCPNYYNNSKFLAVCVYGYPFEISRPGAITISNIKLEKGIKATPYIE